MDTAPGSAESETDHSPRRAPATGPSTSSELARLDALVKTLRARCPWDRRQTHASLAPHLMEEAYEALDAIEDVAASEPTVPSEVVDHLEEELGDVLFQVLFHSVLAEEEGRFTLEDVARSLHDKLVRRHPHVFGDAVADTPEEVAARWEVLKGSEKGRQSATGGIPSALPSLALTAKLLRKAESIGRDLPSASDLQSNAAADLERLVHADRGELETPEDLADVVGRLLLSVTDLARRMGVDPEIALRAQALGLRRDLEESSGTESG